MNQIPVIWSAFATMCALPNGRKFIVHKHDLNFIQKIEQNGSFCEVVEKNRVPGYTRVVINWLLHQSLMSVEKGQDYAAALVFPTMQQLKHLIDTAFCQANSIRQYTDGLIGLSRDTSSIKIYLDELVGILDFCNVKTLKKGCRYDAIFLCDVSIDKAFDSGLLPDPNCKKLIVIQEYIKEKIVRGGAFYLKDPIKYRSALRGHGSQDNNYMPTGLRLVIKNDRNS